MPMEGPHLERLRAHDDLAALLPQCQRVCRGGERCLHHCRVVWRNPVACLPSNDTHSSAQRNRVKNMVSTCLRPATRPISTSPAPPAVARLTALVNLCVYTYAHSAGHMHGHQQAWRT